MILDSADTAGLEPDARLTAMWLWTLVAPGGGESEDGSTDDESPDASEEDGSGGKAETGYTLEYDAARKIAQGLGAKLEELSNVVQVKGDKARLLAVSNRARYLFGTEPNAPTAKKTAKKKQLSMFSEIDDAAEAEGWGDVGAPRVGMTTLDRVHQSMLLFASGRSEGSEALPSRGGSWQPRPVLEARSGSLRPLPSWWRREALGGRSPRSQEGPGLRVTDLSGAWSTRFFAILEDDRASATELREASLGRELGRWTAALTGVVVRSLQSLGLSLAAKGVRCDALPVGRNEYLGQDVMAFAGVAKTWTFPVAVCELENAASDTRVAYSLWKVLCVRASLRVVFCFRPELAAGAPLVAALADSVVGAIPITERAAISGDTLIVVGTRGEGVTFPYGFFRIWKLSPNTGRFERFGRK